MVPTDWQQQKASTIAFTELSVSSSSGLLTVSRMLWGWQGPQMFHPPDKAIKA